MREGKELLVGSVIAAAILVAVVGTLWLQGTNWGRPVTVVEVWVRDVAQLDRGNPVVYRGVAIGRVASITVDSTGAFVRIRAELDGDVVIPEEAQGLVSPQSLFGDWQLDIVTRARYPRVEFYDVPALYYENGVRVIGGFAIPDISQLTLAAEEISTNLAVLTDRFDRAFSEETAERMSQFILNVEEISGDIREMIQQQAATFERVGTEVERAATEISEASVVGRGTLERLENLLARGEIDSMIVYGQRAMSSLDEAAAQVRESTEQLGPTLARADSTFEVMSRLVGRVERGEGTLGMLLMDPAIALRTAGALSELELLLADIRANPGRYVRLSLF